MAAPALRPSERISFVGQPVPSQLIATNRRLDVLFVMGNDIFGTPRVIKFERHCWDSRNTKTPSLVARASRPLWRGHPARKFAGAGRPSNCGRDGRATSNSVTLFCKPL